MGEIMSLLDFVIIGLPKAGTSSLYSWLNAHPQIQGSNPKEPFFFMDTAHPLARREANYHVQGIDSYKQFFLEPRQGRLRFEATTHYFYQQTAINYITQLKPQPLVIIVLRKPSERIYSSFRFTQENLANMDRSLTFNQYVEHLLNKNMASLKHYFYSESSYYIACHELELSKYLNWLDRWSERLHSNKLHTTLFEDLKHNPKKVVKDICDKLDVESSFYDSFRFEPKNQTISINNQWLHRLARQWGSKIPSGKIKEFAKSWYYQMQQSKLQPPQDTWSEGLKMLDVFFEPWNRGLEEKYSLDL